MIDELLSKISECVRKSIEDTVAPLVTAAVDKLAREITEAIPELPSIATKKVEHVRRVIDRAFEVAKVRGRGRLREVMLIVNTTNLRLELVVDNRDVFPSHNDLNDLIAVSPYLKYLDVFESDGTYVVRVSDIHFLKGFTFFINPLGKITLSRALVLYDLIT